VPICSKCSFFITGWTLKNVLRRWQWTKIALKSVVKRRISQGSEMTVRLVAVLIQRQHYHRPKGTSFSTVWYTLNMKTKIYILTFVSTSGCELVAQLSWERHMKTTKLIQPVEMNRVKKTIMRPCVTLPTLQTPPSALLSLIRRESASILKSLKRDTIWGTLEISIRKVACRESSPISCRLTTSATEPTSITRVSRRS